MAIRIITDTGSDLNLQEANELGVELVPLTVKFGDKVFNDGYDMSKDEFYRMIENRDHYPETGAPAPQAYKDKFDKVIADGDVGICFTISKVVSASYQSAVVAAQGLEDKIYVFDSKSAAIGERLQVEYALKRIKEGIEYQELIDELETIKHNVRIYAYLHTLEYVKTGGRLSKFTNTIGGFLNIKPILHIDEAGQIVVPDKARGLKKGLALLHKFVEDNGGYQADKLYVSHSGVTRENMDKYLEDNKEFIGNMEVHESQLGSTIGSHAGNGTVVVAYLRK